METLKKYYENLKLCLKSLFLPNSPKENTDLAIEDNIESQQEVQQESKEEIERKLAELEEIHKKFDAQKRTLLTRLYALEQEIVIFEFDFPKEYADFMKKIEVLRQTYNSNLEEIRKELTYEIDPELNGNMIGKVIMLEVEAKNFIEGEVKFNKISKRLQKIILKLNMLYNVSMIRSKDHEKERMSAKLKVSIEALTEIAKEFKGNEQILKDKQLKERIINLISYADYLIFKANIRITNQPPHNLIEEMVMMTEFDKFDYVKQFIAFAKDEISDLIRLIPLIESKEYQINFKNRTSHLLETLTYYKDEENPILDISFWDKFLHLESSLFEVLKNDGVEEEKIKVKTIESMCIAVDKSEVLVTPKTLANLSLMDIYSSTHDARILLLVKLLNNISDDITYKEIYFLLLLFDAIEVLEKEQNSLVKNIEKYLQKYPYTKKAIIKKRQKVKEIANKEYVIAFTLDNHEKEIIDELNKLDFDFKLIGKDVAINSFYFKDLENVLYSLRANTKYTI